MRYRREDMMKEIRSFADDFYLEHLRYPSMAEIAGRFSFNKSTAYRYLLEMNEKGMITYRDGQISTGVKDKVKTGVVSIPVAGRILCGSPEEEEEYIEEYIQFPKSVAGDGECYLLRASGDSMADAGISEGDMVMIRRQQHAQPGEIVAALCEDGSTLKRLKYDEKRGRMVLHPENKKYEDIVPEQIMVQGVAVYVVKSLKV